MFEAPSTADDPKTLREDARGSGPRQAGPYRIGVFDMIVGEGGVELPGSVATKNDTLRLVRYGLPNRAEYEINFPRVEGYTQAIRNKITVDWTSVPSLELQPDRIPPEVEMNGLNVNNIGRLSLTRRTYATTPRGKRRNTSGS